MCKGSYFSKATAFVVALSFFVTTILSPTYLLAQEPIALSPQTFNFSLKDVLLPETVGTIQDLYSRTASDERVIIEIQDAHGIFEAQKNIQELIQLFQDKYQVNTIGLEGGVGWISSAVYRSLPDAEIKKKLVMDYLKRGELSGGEAAMILSPKKGDFYGIEDRDLYFKNRKAFLDNLKVRPGIMRSLDALTQKLDAIRETVYSSQLRDFDEKVKDYRAERISLLDFVNILQTEAQGLGISIESKYPALWTLFIAEAKDREMARPEMEKEGSRFIREINEVIQKALPAEELREFNAKFQDYQTGQVDQVAFLQYLHGKASAHNIPIQKYEDIQSYFSYRENLQRLEGERLFAETDQLIKEIKRDHFRTDEEGQLDSVYDHIEVIRKLANLEALHEDLALYEAHPEEYKADFFNRFLAKYHDRLTVNWELSASERFYQYARERDQVLFDNFMKALKEKKQSKGILVTGGFHTEGLKVKFKEAGYSYLVLSPRITQFNMENPYEKIMSGQLSYYQPEQSKLQATLATAGLNKEQRDAFVEDFFEKGLTFAQAEQKLKEKISPEAFATYWKQQLVVEIRQDEGVLADPSRTLNLLTRALQSTLEKEGGETSARAGEVAATVAKAEGILRNAIVEGINKNYESFSAKLKDFLTQANQRNLPISATSLAVLATGDVSTALQIAKAINDLSKTTLDEASLNAAAQNIEAFQAIQKAKGGEVIQAMDQVTKAVPEAYRSAALREAVALREGQAVTTGRSLGAEVQDVLKANKALVDRLGGAEAVQADIASAVTALDKLGLSGEAIVKALNDQLSIYAEQSLIKTPDDFKTAVNDAVSSQKNKQIIGLSGQVIDANRPVIGKLGGANFGKVRELVSDAVTALDKLGLSGEAIVKALNNGLQSTESNIENVDGFMNVVSGVVKQTAAGKSLGGSRANEIGFQRRAELLDGAERTAFLEIANVLYDVGMINNAELEEGIVNLDFNIFQILGGLDEKGNYLPGQSYDGDADFLHRASELKGLLNKSNAMQPFAHSYNLIVKTLREVLKRIPPEKTALQNAIIDQYLDDIAVTGLYADVIGVSDLMPTPGAAAEQRGDALKTRARFLQWFDKTRQDMAQKHSNLAPDAQEGIWQANYILHLATDWVKSDTDMLDMGKAEITAVNRKVAEHLLSRVPATQPLRKGDLAVLPTALDQGDIVLKDRNGNITGPNPAYFDVKKPLAEGGFNLVYLGLDGTPLEGHVIKILKNKPLGLDGLDKKISDRRRELTKLIADLLSPSMQSKELTSPDVVAEVNVLKGEKDQLTKIQGLLAPMRKTGVSDPAALAEINRQVDPTYIDRLVASGISPANSFYIDGESRAIIQARGKPYMDLVNASIETLRGAANIGPYREEAAQRLAAGLSRPGATVGKSLGGDNRQALEDDPMRKLAAEAEKFYAENAGLLASETGVGSASVKTATRQMAEERIPGVSADYLKSRDGKIAVIPDIHGNVEALIARLVQDGLIGNVVFKKGTKEVESFEWTGGRAEVVFLGDLLDRDPNSQEVSDLVRAVQKQAREAGGTVVRLAGNHEIGVLQLYGEIFNADKMKGRAGELEKLIGKSPSTLTQEDRGLLAQIIAIHSAQPANLRDRIAPFYDQLMMSGDNAKILQALRLGRDLTKDAKKGDLVATHSLPSETGRQIVFAHSYVPPHLRFEKVGGVWKELTGDQFVKAMNERFQKAAVSGDFVTDLIFKTGAAFMGYEPVRGQNGDISLSNGQTAGGIFSTYHRELDEKSSMLADSSAFKASDTMFFVGGHTNGTTIRMGLDSMTIDKGAAQKYFGQVSALKISLKDGAINFQIDTISLDKQNRPLAEPSVDLEFGPASQAARARAAEVVPIEDIQNALQAGQKVSVVTRTGTVREFTKGEKGQFVITTIKDGRSTTEPTNLDTVSFFVRAGYNSGTIAEVNIYLRPGTALLTHQIKAGTPSARPQVVKVSPVFGRLGFDWASQVGKIPGLTAQMEKLLKEGADPVAYGVKNRLFAHDAGDTIIGGMDLTPLQMKAAEQWKASEWLQSRTNTDTTYEALSREVGAYGIRLAPGTVDGKPTPANGEAYELIGEALDLMPQDVLNSGILKSIQLNAGRDQGAKASAYNSGNVLIYPWALKNRRTFTALLLHEMGHGVFDFLELNTAYASQLNDLKKAHSVLLDQALFLGVDYGLGDAVSRAGYQGLFDEFIAEMNMTYIAAGNRMREHINSIQDPRGRAAFISAYNAFKALHRGREFQESEKYTAISEKAPQTARMNFAKLTPDMEKVRIKQSEILAWAKGKRDVDPNVIALVNYLKAQKTDKEIAAFFTKLTFKDKTDSADASAKTFKLFADKFLDELVIPSAAFKPSAGNEVRAEKQAAAVSNLAPAILGSMKSGEAKVLRMGDVIQMNTTAYGADYAGFRELELGVNSKGELRLLDRVNRKKFAIGTGATVRFKDGTEAKVTTVDEAGQTITLQQVGRSLGVDPELADEIKNLFEDDKKLLGGYDFTSPTALEDFKAQLNKIRDAFLANFTVISEEDGSLDLAFYKAVNLLVNDSRRDAIKFYNQSENEEELARELDPEKRSEVFKDSQKIVLDAITAAQQKLNPMGQPLNNVIRKDQPYVQALGWLQDAISKTQLKDLKPDTRNLAIPGLVSIDMTSHPSSEMTGDDANVDISSDGIAIRVADARGHGPKAAFLRQLAALALSMTPRDDSGAMDYGFTHRLMGTILKTPALSGLYSSETVFNFVPEAGGYKLLVDKLGGMDRSFIFSTSQPEAVKVSPENVRSKGVGLGLTSMEMKMPVGKYTPLTLAPGDLFVAFTDGIEEQIDDVEIGAYERDDIKDFQTSIIQEIKKRYDQDPNMDPDDVREFIRDYLKANNIESGDDYTIVAFKMPPLDAAGQISISSSGSAFLKAHHQTDASDYFTFSARNEFQRKLIERLRTVEEEVLKEAAAVSRPVETAPLKTFEGGAAGQSLGKEELMENIKGFLIHGLGIPTNRTISPADVLEDQAEVAKFIDANRETPQVILDVFDVAFQDSMKNLSLTDLRGFVESIAQSTVQKSSFEAFKQVLDTAVGTRTRVAIGEDAARQLYEIVYRGTVVAAQSAAVTALTATSGLQALMLENPEVTKQVLQSLRERLGLDQASKNETPIHLVVTTKGLEPGLIANAIEKIGVDSVDSPLLTVGIALFDTEKNAALASLAKSSKGAVQLIHVSSNKVTRAAGDLNSTRNSDKAKVIFSGSATEASAIAQKTTGKVLPVNFAPTAIEDLDKIISEVIIKAAWAENPTSYIEDKLKNMVRIENGVVGIVVTAILEEFQRQLEEARVQAIAA